MISIIRQHRTIYHAAKIVLILGLVLLSVQGHGYGLSYWDAIFEIGFNPKTQTIDVTNACIQIERLAGFRKAIRELPVFDEQLNNQIQQIESQISSFDAGNLYDQLPYSENNGKWRGIGIRGGLDAESYRLGIVDPEVENWVKTASTELPKPWRPQEQFGDFGLKAFVRPVKKDIEDMTRQFFQTLAFGNNGDGVFMHFGSIPATLSNYTLSFGTDAEVLSNGTIRFAHNLQRQMIREEKELVDEIKRFEQQLWEAFYLDFSRIKSLGYCDKSATNSRNGSWRKAPRRSRSDPLLVAADF